MMTKSIDKEYNEKISQRIFEILEFTGLEIKGISALTNQSTDIFYSVISCRRILTKKLAKIIGNSLDFDGTIIFNINIPIPKTIKGSNNLKKFIKENKHNIEYFKDTWSNNKFSNIIMKELIEKSYFLTPRFTWEVSDKLRLLEITINSDLLNKQLKYFVKKNILTSKKVKIKKRNGESGKRLVDQYSNNFN